MFTVYKPTIVFMGLITLDMLATPALAVIPSRTGFHLLVTPGQPMFGVNLDGVARVRFNGETTCTAALTSDQHLLSAAHCFDQNVDGAIELSTDTILEIVLEDSAGEFKMEFFSTDVILPPNWTERSADISIIKLPSSVPDAFPRYPLYGGRDELGQQIVVVGYGYTGTGATGSTISLDAKLAGLNRYEALGASIDGERFVPFPADDMLVYDFDSGMPANNTLEAMGFISDVGFGPDEVKSADGDSGGPVFINGAIAGISSFGEWGFETDFDPDVIGTWGELSFNTRLSSFQEFILTATNKEAVFVPEPSSLCLAILAVILIPLACRR